MKSLRYLAGLLLACIALYITCERIYHFLTDGFSISRVLKNEYYIDTALLKKPSEENFSIVKQVLKQKFSYLGKGTQSFAFISEDGNYVLKLYKHHRHRRLEWLQFFCKFPFHKNYEKRKLLQKQHFQETFYSFKLSEKKLKKETGLIYFHCAPQPYLRERIKVRNALGVPLIIDTDQVDFMIQKKATLLKPLITEKMERGEVQECKKILEDIVLLLKTRCEKGIGDRDPGLTYNMGFTEEGPIFIDLGQFFKDTNLKNPTIALMKIYDITGTLRDWLKVKYPELEAHLLKQVTPS